jgi:hypothetical protein
MRTVLLVSILLFTFVSRLALISQIPTLSAGSNISFRYVNIFIDLCIVFCIFYYSKKRSGSIKLGLITAWVLSVLFWSFEQGRVISQVNLGVLFLLMYLIGTLRKNIKYTLLSTLIFFFFLTIVYPQFWIFRKTIPVVFGDILKNFFSTISFDQLFFKNIYFWWGSVRDFGILNLSFAPFFVIGVFQSFYKKEFQIIIGTLLVILMTTLSPYYPETKELYFAVPFFSYFIACGLYSMSNQKLLGWKLVFMTIILYFMYELTGYYHYYFVHYAVEVTNNISRIHEAF